MPFKRLRRELIDIITKRRDPRRSAPAAAAIGEPASAAEVSDRFAAGHERHEVARLKAHLAGHGAFADERLFRFGDTRRARPPDDGGVEADLVENRRPDFDGAAGADHRSLHTRIVELDTLAAHLRNRDRPTRAGDERE